MTQAILISLPFYYILVTLAHAHNHAYRITYRNQLITSARKGLEFLFISAVSLILFSFFTPTMPLLVLPVLVRAAFYDWWLNVFRGKNWLYEGEISRKKGWTDWLENKIGLPTIVYRLIYMNAFVGYCVFYYLKIVPNA